MQPIFITVDPERDTPDVLAQYTGAFDPRIVGLTGSPQQVADAAAQYGAYSERHATGTGAGDYVVDHSTYIYIMDPEGRFVRGLDFGVPAETHRRDAAQGHGAVRRMSRTMMDAAGEHGVLQVRRTGATRHRKSRGR